MAAMLAAFAAGGCGLVGGGDGDAETGRKAATAYLDELATFAAAVEEAAQRKGASLEDLVAEPPTLEEVDTDASEYAAARTVAARVDAIAAELERLETQDWKRLAKFDNRLYDVTLGFADDVIARSTDHLERTQDLSVRSLESSLADLGDAFGGEGGKKARGFNEPAAHQKLDLRAMRAELRAWAKFRERVAAVPTRTDLEGSLAGYELDQIDKTMDFYEEFRDHLRSQPAEHTQFEYYDDLWPDRDPLRYLASGALTSAGQPWLRSLLRGELLRRELVRGIVELAEEGAVDAESPSVGDAYRKAILEGFLPPTEKERYRLAIIAYRAWMLDRIRELERTPNEAYRAARDTLMAELTDGDPRNPYNRLLAAFACFRSLPGISTRKDLARLRELQRFVGEEFADPFPPILETARKQFVRAIEAIDLDVVGRQLEATDVSAYDRARKELERAEKKIKRALRDGARAIDSPKRLRKALEEALDATRPEP